MSLKLHHFLLSCSYSFFHWPARSPQAPEWPKLLGHKLCLHRAAAQLQHQLLGSYPGEVSQPPDTLNLDCLKSVSFDSFMYDSDRLPQPSPLLPLNTDLTVDSWGFRARVGGSQEVPALPTLGMIPSLVCDILNLLCLYLSECESGEWYRGVWVCMHTCTLHWVPAWYQNCLLRMPV